MRRDSSRVRPLRRAVDAGKSCDRRRECRQAPHDHPVALCGWRARPPGPRRRPRTRCRPRVHASMRQRSPRRAPRPASGLHRHRAGRPLAGDGRGDRRRRSWLPHRATWTTSSPIGPQPITATVLPARTFPRSRAWIATPSGSSIAPASAVSGDGSGCSEVVGQAIMSRKPPSTPPWPEKRTVGQR